MALLLLLCGARFWWRRRFDFLKERIWLLVEEMVGILVWEEFKLEKLGDFVSINLYFALISCLLHYLFGVNSKVS